MYAFSVGEMDWVFEMTNESKKKITYKLYCEGGDSSEHESIEEAKAVGPDCPQWKTHEIYKITKELVYKIEIV